MRIGCSGWGRIGLHIPKEERAGKSLLESYAEIFDCVEVNSSFYQYHRESTYRAWRSAVGDEFSFALKAHRDITHVHRMSLNEQVLESLDRMAKACEALAADVLLFQTPASFRYSPESLSLVRELLQNVDLRGVPLAWETRGESWRTSEAREELEKVLSETETTHVVDIFRDRPVYTGKLAYFRLHGLGKKMYDYKFTDQDLARLSELIEPYLDRPGFLFFNNYEMYDDASRFLRVIRSSKGGHKD